jgi:hypothetical protein
MKWFLKMSFVVLCLVCLPKAAAQEIPFQDTIPPFLVIEGDTVRTLILRDTYIYPARTFTSARQEEQYLKMIRDVKKTLPYARLIYGILIETYEYMLTLPDDKARDAHLKQMEKDLFSEYKPILKKMTLSQGKLLIKLIDRECNQSSYNIVKAYLGPFRASFWNLFAGLFGASLKSEWEPDGKDAAIERIVQMEEMGLLD